MSKADELLAAGRSAYPSAFRLPNGRYVRPRTMMNAMRVIRSNPDGEYPGWDWFSVPGHFIIREVRRGIDDRINMRAAILRARQSEFINDKA